MSGATKNFVKEDANVSILEESRTVDEELEAAAARAAPAHPWTALSSARRPLGSLGTIFWTLKVNLELTYLELTLLNTSGLLRRTSADIPPSTVVGGLLEQETTVPYVDQLERKWERQREGRKLDCSRET